MTKTGLLTSVIRDLLIHEGVAKLPHCTTSETGLQLSVFFLQSAEPVFASVGLMRLRHHRSWKAEVLAIDLGQNASAWHKGTTHAQGT
jgi:hypothetical protein